MEKERGRGAKLRRGSVKTLCICFPGKISYLRHCTVVVAAWLAVSWLVKSTFAGGRLRPVRRVTSLDVLVSVDVCRQSASTLPPPPLLLLLLILPADTQH